MKKDFGSLHYYLALAHRAHLLIDLNQVREAQLLVQQLRVSNFPEVKAAVEVIESIISEAQKGRSA